MRAGPGANTYVYTAIQLPERAVRLMPRLSEIRVSELLDTLCIDVSSRYQLASRDVEGLPAWEWTSDASGTVWTRVSQAEDQQHKKELENYCVRLVSDEFEDELTMALQSESSVDLEELLCGQLSKACAAKPTRTEL